MNNVIEITGRKILEISPVSQHNEYHGKKAGKFYNNYRYNGIVFSVDESDPFCKNLEAGKVNLVKLIEGTREVEVTDSEGNASTVTKPTFQFDTSISSTQLIGMMRAEAEIAALEKALANITVSADTLQQLEGAI